MAMNSPTAYLAIAIFVSLSSIFSTVTSDLTEINAPHLQTHQHCSNSDNSLACEIQEMKFKVARLELLSETTSQELYTKSLQIGNCDKKIEELSRTIHNLESDLSNLKDAPDYEEIIKLLEEQVRELEADVRRNDKNLHHLKVKAEDDKKSVELLASKVETMAKIVPELWFHVQKLEQACEVIERRTGELRRHLRNQKCSFFKFINKLPVRHYQKMVVPYTSKALHQLRRSASVAKKYHHQLQGFVKRKMERNESTAVLAGEELVFFLVSIVVVFPIILALRWLLSVFSLASSVVVFLLTFALRLLSLVPFLVSQLWSLFLSDEEKLEEVVDQEGGSSLPKSNRRICARLQIFARIFRDHISKYKDDASIIEVVQRITSTRKTKVGEEEEENPDNNENQGRGRGRKDVRESGD
ncbi:uncharacterized protein [Spinacia oleracea]|uniref:Uncharacterized protein isoform X1 n=1 Tax=Spinacia oleracea TaxID=3562 RepID=A0ABM3QUP6_SPIOL|nr:uncharacterized protein LOC110784887 isoform X1 [Spinacia oleracea]